MRLVSCSRAALQNGDDGLKLGLLLGFFPTPALYKDIAGTLVICIPSTRLLVLRLPSVIFYASALSYFGHKARILGQHAAARGLIAEGIPVSREELAFGLVAAAMLTLIAAHAHRVLTSVSLNAQELNEIANGKAELRYLLQHT